MAQLSNLMLITDILVQINAIVSAIAILAILAIAILVFQIFCIADVVDRCQMGGIFPSWKQITRSFELRPE